MCSRLILTREIMRELGVRCDRISRVGSVDYDMRMYVWFFFFDVLSWVVLLEMMGHVD